jgi:hypothetical protein
VRRGTSLLAVLAALSVSPSGCGDDPQPRSLPSTVTGESEVAHIHGLGVNPADDALIIATHTGLFRAAPGHVRPRRIGDRRQDTMGFSVVGPDRFVGSGHPDARDDLPPLLGFIRSSDGGESWDTVSLLGEADFHVLRSAGPQVYGVNSADGALMVSIDGGQRWERRSPPGPLLDLAPQPGRRETLIASGEDRLHLSGDAGKTWRPVANDRAGLLAWPTRDRLFLVDGAGTVRRSSDAGRSWEQVGEVGGQPAAFSSHESELYVALHTNEVKVSRDGGRSWQLRVAA